MKYRTIVALYTYTRQNGHLDTQDVLADLAIIEGRA